MKQSKKKWWQKLCIILGTFLLLIFAIVIGGRLYFRLPVSDYYHASEKAFVIPGLSDDFVPQGISYDQSSDLFFITGYQEDYSASPIYLVNGTTGEIDGKVLLMTTDGSDCTLHAGGLSVLGDYVYVAGGDNDCLYVYSRNAILNAADGDHISCLGEFDTYFDNDDGVAVAFTTTNDGKLTVGEFYRDPNYPTPNSHKFTTPSGEYQQALAVTYLPSDAPDAVFGLNPVPVEAYTLPDITQGMAFYDGKIWLSISYAAAFSNIYAYDISNLQPFGTLPTADGNIPLYSLDSATISNSYKLPPMSEEIEFVNGKMYTISESASNLYFFGKLTGGQWCYATSISELTPEE